MIKTKSFLFDLQIYFEDPISEDHVDQITQNILRAIKGEVESGKGIAPEDSDTYTTEVEVSYDGENYARYKWRSLKI